ncbi:CRACD-like protein isoform X2 [Xenopus laevis]|uniref:CRACD-like protein isoform X2 n=1 Tax=Xenopus laevis TaxID=8355 RepID=A0A8J1MB70_XENLA|nr:CRACD-like protein isoform X2 [Xenopus laevis]
MDVRIRDAENLVDDCSAKKKSKFKSFKKFFGKKKRKETLSSTGKFSLKQSQSTSDVTYPEFALADVESEDEIGSSAGILGSRAVSHDSIFIPELTQENAKPVRVFSQENVSDRIKALQLKLQSNLKPGLSPFGILGKRTDDAGTISEDDGLPRSPPELSLYLHEVTKPKFSDNHHSTFSLAGTGSEEDEQISSGHSSRPLSPEDKSSSNIRVPSTGRRANSLISQSADFDSPPQLCSFLDSSAAKHRLSVRPRNQRSCTSRRPSASVLDESVITTTFTEVEDENVMEEAVSRSTNDNQEMVIDSNAVFDTPQSIQETETLAGPGSIQSPLMQEEAVISSNELELISVVTSQSQDATSSQDIKLQNKLLEDLQDKCARSLSILEGNLCDEVQVKTDFSKEDGLPQSLRSEKRILKGHRKSLESAQEKVIEKPFLGPDVSSPPSNISQTEPLPTEDLPLSGTEKSRNTPEQSIVDNENIKHLEKAAGEIESTNRKFSVSSAWERPRTGSFTLKGNIENETFKNMKFTLPKSGLSVHERMKDEPRFSSTHTESEASVRKNEMFTDSESTSVDKAILSHIPLPQSSVPASSDLPMVTDLQTCSENKNPFFVKLRSTSFSFRYREGINSDSVRLKRHSAEINLENTGCSSFSKDELLEVSKTESHFPSLRNEKQKTKTNSSELTQAKPPLPKKPVLQNNLGTDNATKKDSPTCVSDLEKKNCKMEKTLPERRTSLHSLHKTGKSTPSPIAAPESINPVQTSWISMSRQKPRALKDEPVQAELKSANQDAGNQNREKTEANLKQFVDLIQNKPANAVAEFQGQDTKAELKEQRQRASTLSLPAHDKTPKRQATLSAEPTWMELAKKKSQAWSEMPQKRK